MLVNRNTHQTKKKIFFLDTFYHVWNLTGASSKVDQESKVRNVAQLLLNVGGNGKVKRHSANVFKCQCKEPE